MRIRYGNGSVSKSGHPAVVAQEPYAASNPTMRSQVSPFWPCHAVHEVVDDPKQRAREIAAQLADLGPLALEFAKEAVHRGSELPLRDGLRLEGDLNHQLAATHDRADGLAAFFDKRPPDFAGR